MPDGMASWFLTSMKTPPTHRIIVGTLRHRKPLDALRKRGSWVGERQQDFVSDPRYGERIVAGRVFRRGLFGGPRRSLSDSARDIAIAVDVVRDSYNLSSGGLLARRAA